MNKKPIISIMTWIVGGIIVGSFIGALGYYRILPENVYNTLSSITIRVCIGLIVLIVDLLCAWGLIRPAINKYVDNHGDSTTGVIDNFVTLTKPDQLQADEWTKQSRYSFTISYEVDQKKYTKEFPPTILTSKRELYPHSIDKGDSIELKYLKKNPKLSLINIDVLKKGSTFESENARIHLIFIPLIITAIYIIGLIMI
ncbi:MAG: hypothetical protein K2K14_00140 [Ruminococcus sp.]|nr:hypothetical protein [Ruminococcus sp.]